MADQERQLEREGAQRIRVAVISLLAGVAYFAGELVSAVVEAKDPNIGLLQGLRPALAGLAAAKVDPRTVHEQFLVSHQWPLIIALVVTGLGAAAMVVPLNYLAMAERLRSPSPSRVTPYLARYAPPVIGILVPVYEISLIIGAHSYLSGSSRTSAAVSAATGGGGRTAVVLVVTLGELAVAAAFIMVSLRSMRVGLMTRMLGGFGIVSGVLFLIPLTPLPVVQSLWLVFVAAMLLGFGRKPLPEAWTVAEARPWPSPPPRERRPPRQSRPSRSTATAPPAPEPVMPRGSSSAPSKKRKRRR